MNISKYNPINPMWESGWNCNGYSLLPYAYNKNQYSLITWFDDDEGDELGQKAAHFWNTRDDGTTVLFGRDDLVELRDFLNEVLNEIDNGKK